MKMKPNALKLYMVLFDRMKLSMQNEWKDDQDRYYVRMSQDGASELFGWSPTTFRSMKKELEKFDLLMQVQEGQGKTNRLYIAKCRYEESDIYRINKEVDAEMEENEMMAQTVDMTKKNKSCSSRRTKVDLLEEQKLTTNKNNLNNTDLNDNEFIGNNLLTSSQDDTSDRLILEYMKKGLSKEVCLRVLNEVKMNPHVENFGGYFRAALENALDNSSVKHGRASKVDVLEKRWQKKGLPLYDWTKDISSDKS